MAKKLIKKQARMLIVLAVAALAAYWAWANWGKTHEHGGTAVKEHGGQ